MQSDTGDSVADDAREFVRQDKRLFDRDGDGVETAETPVLPTGLSEEWTFDRDIACPQCQYNLRMMRNPRCPECGTIFRWQALLHIGCPRCGEGLYRVDGDECPRCRLSLDWTRLLSDADPQQLRQFEYTRRPISAAISVCLAALTPTRFWESIRIESPPSVSRLRLFRRICIAACCLGVASVFVQQLAQKESVIVLGLLALVIPLATMTALPMFAPTLARFRVRKDQMLRCMSYASVGTVWIGVLTLVGSSAAMAANLIVGGAPGGPQWVRFDPVLSPLFLYNMSLINAVADPSFLLSAMGLAVVFLLGAVWWWRFLFVSLHDYLRLDRRNTWALMLSTQTIAVLALLIGCFNFEFVQLRLGWLLFS